MVAFSLILLSTLVGAEPTSLPADLEIGDALKQLLAGLGGLKGASALGIAVFVIQGVLLFFRTQLAAFAGKWRLLIVTGLSLVIGVLALSMAGVSWTSALVHANTLAAVQVFIHQLVKQLSEKSEPVPAPIPQAKDDPS